MIEEGRAPVRVAATAPPAAGGDVEGLAILVVLEASKSAEEDLRAVLESVRDIDKAKAALRDKAGPQRPAEFDFEALFHLLAALYAKQLDDELDDLGDLSETDMLRLQMVMDRLSRMISTLSNLLKKCSDASSQIVQNLK